MQFSNLPPSEEFDRDLLRRVNRFLQQKGYAPHRRLEIAMNRGVVVIQGRVPSFYLRQVAVEYIKHVTGVTQIVDLIEVADCPGQCQTNDNSADDQEAHDPSMRDHVNLPDMERTAHDAHQTPVRNRHLLSSSAK